MQKAGVLFIACAGLLGTTLLLPHPAGAAGPIIAAADIPVSTATGDQMYPSIISDGAGGAIIAWQDGRSANWDIYAQRVTAAGTPLWAANGVIICAGTSVQPYPTILSDGAGGAFIAWEDSRNYNNDIYAQRISATGVVQWAANGVAFCTATGVQRFPEMVSDAAGGVVVSWQDGRSGGFSEDVYAQRISAGGVVQWTADGVALSTATGSQSNPHIASDGAGGAIVGWYDTRNGGGNYDVYTQRIAGNGAVQWTANGVAVCLATGNQNAPTVVPDGAGGAIFAWEDARNGSGSHDVYAQRISAAGAPQWTANGVALCTATGNQQSPTATPDGSGGAIVTWPDFRSGASDVYAQRVSAAGAPQWTGNGAALCTASGAQLAPAIATDGAGGAIICWYDARAGNYDIYIQRISAAGAVQWTANGVALCTATDSQLVPGIVADGAGGAVVTWEDYRGFDWDIYAQLIRADGTPVQLSFVGADVGVDGVTLTWHVSGNGNAPATVYRSAGGDQWARIGQVMADGTGYLRYTDRVDATATRLGYRLGIVEAGTEAFCGETWVDLPTLDLVLHGVRPNPASNGALLVHFSLPSAAPARLELVDVSGRGIAAREVGSFGAGRHALDLAEGRRIAPGLYLVRLTQGVNTRVTRVAVLN